MKKKIIFSEEDQVLFRQLMVGIRKIKQDMIVYRLQCKKISEVSVKWLIQEQVDVSYYFLDEFQLLLNIEGLVKYVCLDVSYFEVKKLCCGDYLSELFLDLYGLMQLQVKQELGVLIVVCCCEYVFCVCVMYGHGKYILKQ